MGFLQEKMRRLSSNPKKLENFFFNQKLEKMIKMVEVRKGIKYTSTHEWIKVEGKIGIIGISDFAQHELGEIVYIGFDEAAESFKKGDDLVPIESHKSMDYVKAPVDGILMEKNQKLEDNWELVNKDPYGEGWIAKIEIKNPAQLSELMEADAYSKYLESIKK
jgi:glycine cleavage system H protein